MVISEIIRLLKCRHLVFFFLFSPSLTRSLRLLQSTCYWIGFIQLSFGEMERHFFPLYSVASSRKYVFCVSALRVSFSFSFSLLSFHSSFILYWACSSSQDFLIMKSIYVLPLILGVFCFIFDVPMLILYSVRCVLLNDIRFFSMNAKVTTKLKKKKTTNNASMKNKRKKVYKKQRTKGKHTCTHKV